MNFSAREGLEAAFIAHKSSRLYVVLMKDRGRTSLLVDVALHRPWTSTNKKSADFQATQCGGEARTWQEAFAILLKENPNFEKDLVNQLQQKINRGTSPNTGL